jgi:hypothetical protein
MEGCLSLSDGGLRFGLTVWSARAVLAVQVLAKGTKTPALLVTQVIENTDVSRVRALVRVAAEMNGRPSLVRAVRLASAKGAVVPNAVGPKMKMQAFVTAALADANAELDRLEQLPDGVTSNLAVAVASYLVQGVMLPRDLASVLAAPCAENRLTRSTLAW